MNTTTPGNNVAPSDFSNSTDGVLNKASTGAHATVNAIAGAADDAARHVKPAIDKVAALAHQAVDKAAGAAAPAADWLAGQGESLNATQKKLVEDTCSYVSAHPMKSIAVALAAGFLISRLTR